MLAAEVQVFGANHQEFGAGLCEKWKFPASFAFVTGYHHRPLELAPENRTLTTIIHVADRIAADAGQGFRQDLTNTTISPDVMDLLKLTNEKVTDIKGQLAASMADLTTLLA